MYIVRYLKIAKTNYEDVGGLFLPPSFPCKMEGQCQYDLKIYPSIKIGCKFFYNYRLRDHFFLLLE